MKKLFFFFGFLLLAGTQFTFAQSSVINLYDEVLSLPGCSVSGANSCAELDERSTSQTRRIHRIERFVPGSGYLAVYFKDLSVHGSGFSGGFSFDQVIYEPNSGGELLLGQSRQVFERGTVVIEFEQPYNDDQRLETNYEIVVYYLPHTDIERQNFLSQLQEDPNDFFQYKQSQERNVEPLCEALGREPRLPEVCPEVSGGSDPVPSYDPNSTIFRTDADDLPELDFSGDPIRPPVLTLREEYRQTFINEPVVIEILEVYDPDGKCQFFDYVWQKPSSMQVQDVSVDPRLGDLTFVPLNSGVYTIKARARESCEELGTLYSSFAEVRVVVNDKAVAFPDLLEAPLYANAILELYHLGVVQGYPDGTMRPNAPINRAEFLKIIFETLAYRIEQEAFSPRYIDVQPGDWFAPYVHKADSIGVIKGYPDGRFHPEWTVNLVEALKMVMHFSTIDIFDDTVYSFPDVPNTEWFSRYVKTAFREGILDDIEPGQNVHPGQLLSRGKAMLIVVRTLLFPVNRINYANTDVLRRPQEFQDFSSFDY